MIHNPSHSASPLNPISPVIIVLVLAVFGVEAVFQLAERGLIGGRTGIGWRVEMIQKYAISGAQINYVFQNRDFSVDNLIRFVSYAFLHLGFTQAALYSVMLLALGKTVSDIFHPVSVVALFLICTIGGVLAYGMVDNTRLPFLGVQPAVYGFLGAYTWMMWLTASKLGRSRIGAFTFLFFLTGLQIVFRVIFPLVTGQPINTQLDWVGDGTGFILGFFLSFVLAPDGRARVRRWIAAARNR